MILYAAENSEGELWDFDDHGYWPADSRGVMTTANRHEAWQAAHENSGHVVELTEAPAKVVVSEEEAEMLKTAKNPTFRPSSVITSYSNDHGGWDLTSDLEDRLMRAYVNDWEVEKPERWNVKVPHAKTLIYYKVEDIDDLGVAQCDSEGTWVEFTAAEIEHYGLQDCKRVEVTD